MNEASASCELCVSPGGDLLWENSLCCVVCIDDTDYPGFCRVILKRHVCEMTDLPLAEQAEIMRIVFATEATLRMLLKPDKINLASLGNMCPHVHWHVIPRWENDCNFPNPIWGSALRSSPTRRTTITNLQLRQELVSRLGEPGSITDRSAP